MCDINKFVERMRYWTDYGDLGYDQSNRWDIRVGGECDCSSLVIHCLKEAGFETGSASYTGDMSEELTKNGWTRLPNNGSPKFGDILLNDTNHVAVYVGDGLISYASIDENGKTRGGRAGDQTDRETRTRPYYDYPWSCYLRYKGIKKEDVFDVSTLPMLRKGSIGGYVTTLQSLLNTKAYNKLETDGEFGSLTETATKVWQRSMGLEVDGICGPQTWDSILRR